MPVLLDGFAGDRDHLVQTLSGWPSAKAHARLTNAALCCALPRVHAYRDVPSFLQYPDGSHSLGVISPVGVSPSFSHAPHAVSYVYGLPIARDVADSREEEDGVHPLTCWQTWQAAERRRTRLAQARSPAQFRGHSLCGRTPQSIQVATHHNCSLRGSLVFCASRLLPLSVKRCVRGCGGMLFDTWGSPVEGRCYLSSAHLCGRKTALPPECRFQPLTTFNPRPGGPKPKPGS